jgi:16S rRNA (uracil1498-N3)-methyltransferase
MHRFYYPNADFSTKSIRINDAHEIHHIKDVLRLKAGDKLCIFNAKNQEASAVISAVKDMEVVAAIESVRQSLQKSTHIILACAVPKKAKFEFIIEKCTELGVDEIIPLKTKRTEVIFSKEKLSPKQERFQKVAINAAKQSGRLDVPKIHAMTNFADALKVLDKQGLALIPSLNGKPQHICKALSDAKAKGVVAVFIGPEGDFTPDEVALAEAAGCVSVSLGDTVLKVDTAAMTTVALCRFLLYN